MTTLLPTQDLAAIRAIARTIGVLLVAVRIDQLHPGRATADWEIADILEVDKRTVIKQLRSLSAAGMVLAQGDRYVVTLTGRNTLFGFSGPAVAGATSLSIEETESAIAGEIPAHTMCAVQNDDDDDIKSNIDIESSSSERTKCAQILEATAVLFGSAVNSAGLEGLDPRMALAWVAKAFEDRRKLTNPQGLIYRRLVAREKPAKRYYEQALDILPTAYLVAAGLVEPPVVDVTPVAVQPDYWREVIGDEDMPQVRGVMFHGGEEVTISGEVMTVRVNPRVLEGIRTSRITEAMSAIFARILGAEGARIEFEAASYDG